MMADASDGWEISLPVFLHDGEREINIGSAVVYPSLKFNHLQSAISNRVGLFPHQISIYLAERRLYRSWPRKVPVTAKFNFGTITGGKDLYFLVFLRRSKARGVKAQSVAKNRLMAENVMLLRRDAHVGDLVYGDGNGVPIVDELEYYRRRVREVAAERMRLVMMMDRSNDYAAPSKAPEVFCEDCEKAKEAGPEPEFHSCRNDLMIGGGFRSRAGPICRPGKQ